MTTYKESGVNIEKGDECSALAYAAAKATFAGRAGMIGSSAALEGGFSGALDMGDFYLVQNDDGVGSKMMVAQAMGKFDTVGYDLVAMVADDAICLGAEVISISNTIDIDKVDEKIIGPMMDGLRNACLAEKIVVPGGEIAEIPGQVKGTIWNATAVGIVEKSKFIDGTRVREGDSILGLRSAGFRSNGFSLVRKILSDKFGGDWVNADYGDGRKWGEVVLTPCLIYHRALLGLLGGYGEKRKIDVHALAHITGGGLEGNVERVVKGGLRAEFDNLWEPLEMMTKLIEIGAVPEADARTTWNMGTGMVLIVAPEDEAAVVASLPQFKIQRIGSVVKN
ncbi:phosphoribosylformylglycinamidine cyclo-ligase [Candidatus Peregrinibacteria bacterium]|nr:phosphoribosylformylglycinamidine cyclo-ligase [Candidatus Peregrinibacteria bacterium]